MAGKPENREIIARTISLASHFGRGVSRKADGEGNKTGVQ